MEIQEIRYRQEITVRLSLHELDQLIDCAITTKFFYQTKLLEFDSDDNYYKRELFLAEKMIEKLFCMKQSVIDIDFKYNPYLLKENEISQ